MYTSNTTYSYIDGQRDMSLSKLVSLAEKMQSSYEKLGEQITELKLDHRDGKRESDRLTELLGGHMDCYIIF